MTTLNDKEEKIDILIDRVNNKVKNLGSKQETSIAQMKYSKIYSTSNNINCFYDPCIVCVLQGNKKSIVGNREFDYGRGSTLYICVDMPSTYHFYNITKEKPFISISFDLNTDIIKQIINDIDTKDNPQNNSFGISLDVINDNTLDVLLRLSELEASSDINARKILINPFLTEFYYYMLNSQHGTNIFSFYHKFSVQSGIYKSINYIKQHFRKNEDIVNVATNVAFMQPSTFFKHFKEVTGLSPLQYKKRMRLIEAKKLIEIENMEISQSAYSVGYESVSQFSREFKAFFNCNPSALYKNK